MPKPKLYHLLERLDGRELPWLDKFLASPYFNSNPWPQKLWEVLRPAHPRYDAFSKEQVFEQLCPGKPFDFKLLNDRYSELSRLVEEFFFQQSFRREEPLQRRARRAAYRSRRLYGLFSKESRRQAAHLLSRPYRSPENLAEALEAVDPAAEVHIHLVDLSYIDHACLELLSTWEAQREALGGQMVIEWDELHAMYHNPMIFKAPDEAARARARTSRETMAGAGGH